jgi:hypothetical protein
MGTFYRSRYELIFALKNGTAPHINSFELGQQGRHRTGRAALSQELNLAARNLEVPVLAQAAVAARHVWNASSRRTRSVRREVRWRWTLKVFWTAA